jgi:single-stranded-DNA-specific exonuclease
MDFFIHENKEVGLPDGEELEEMKEYDLVIIPDAGSSQYKKHKELSDAGTSIIVLDHHEASKESEYAMVVNNQLSPDYNNKFLSGAGVAFKFCQALDDVNSINFSEQLVDLAALGIASDNMDMRLRDNIVIVRRGVKLMNDDIEGNLFIKALIKKKSYSLGDNVYPIDIMFYIAPLINAVIRLGNMQEKTMMFKAFILDGSKVIGSGRNNKGQLVFIEKEMARIAGNIKIRQKKAETNGMKKLTQLVEKDQLGNKIIILNATNIIERSMTGLVANKIQDKYNRPTLILLKNDKDGLFYGSGRCPSGTKLNEFKKYLNNTGLVEYAEGHQAAFGTCIKPENVEPLKELSNKLLKDYDFEKVFSIDFLMDSTEVSSEYIFKLNDMKHLWGTRLREPKIMVSNIKIDASELQLIGKKSNIIKIIFNGVEYIMFRAEEIIANIPDGNSLEISLIGKPNTNEWNGKVTPQIIVDECEIEASNSFVF